MYIIHTYPCVTPSFDALLTASVGETFPEAFHPCLEWTLPLFNNIPVTEGFHVQNIVQIFAEAMNTMLAQ